METDRDRDTWTGRQSTTHPSELTIDIICHGVGEGVGVLSVAISCRHHANVPSAQSSKHKTDSNGQTVISDTIISILVTITNVIVVVSTIVIMLTKKKKKEEEMRGKRRSKMRKRRREYKSI